ncbi:MAG: DUF2806 domain-containing protein [Proteobacteria bacterium]|nr:DUF2806 domain-containing protein [Pseudomonadota bacterium]
MARRKGLNQALGYFVRQGGGWLRPAQIIREGAARTEARRHNLLVLAQTERDIKDIRAGKKTLNKDRKLVSLPPPADHEVKEQTEADGSRDTAIASKVSLDQVSIISSVQHEVTIHDLDRFLNLAKIILAAEEEVENTPNEEVSDDPMDNDWFTRWRDNAQDISSEMLQRLWARILAGELKRPGSYTIHTLDFLRRMSKEDAETITKIARFRIGNCIFSEAAEDLNKNGITFDTLIDLDDLGIIHGVQGFGSLNWTPPHYRNDPAKFLMVSNNKALVVTTEDVTKEPGLPAY